jgi:hypothetical protein
VNDGLGILLNGQLLTNGVRADTAGGDTVGYGTRTFTAAGSAGVTADLDGNADDGASGEGDRIDADVEALVGSIRDDKLNGNSAPNLLEGRIGVDQLVGAQGPDRLRLKDGIEDKCFSLTSGDAVDADLVDPTVASCFASFSTFTNFALTSPSALTVSVNFQPVDETIPYVQIGSRLRKVRGGALRAQVRCSRTAVRACTGTLAVGHATRERALARRRFRVRPGRRATIVLRPSRRSLAALEKAGRARLTSTSRGTSDLGPTTTFVIREI